VVLSAIDHGIEQGTLRKLPVAASLLAAKSPTRVSAAPDELFTAPDIAGSCDDVGDLVTLPLKKGKHEEKAAVEATESVI
jgi:hypothetical protein